MGGTVTRSSFALGRSVRAGTMTPREDPLDPVLGGLRARRQLGGGLPAAAARPRGLAGAHRALLQPHRVRRVARPAARPGRRPRCDRRASTTAGCSAQCDAVLSGYQGDPAVGAVILDAVAHGEGGQPGRRLLLRPGDGRRRPRHVRPARDPGVHARHRGAAGRHPHAQPLRARLPGRHDDRARWTRCWPRSTRSATAVRATCWSPRCCTPTYPPRLARRRRRLRRRAPGRSPPPCSRSRRTACGDVTAALYLAHLTTTGSPATALERTTASVFAVLEATLAAGTREIQLVAAQDAIAAPPATFPARQLR